MSEPQPEQATGEQPAESSYVDIAQAIPVEKPEGSPELVPLLQLPRRKRPDVLRRLKALTERQANLPTTESGEAVLDPAALADPAKVSAGLDTAAEMYELLADFEEMLEVVAADPDEFRKWAARVSDVALGQLAGYYMRTMQAGEAQASPES